jgi:hypothetical protein
VRKRNLVFTNKTGNGDSSIVKRGQLLIGNILRLPVMAKIATTVTTTPSAVVTLYGYLTASSSWVSLGAKTITTATTTYIHAASMPKCTKYRLTVSSNTNVTLTSAYIGVGRVEN